MGSRMTEVATSMARALVTVEGMLNRLCSLLANGWFGKAFKFSDDVRWCDIRVLAIFLIAPSSSGVAVLLGWWLQVELCISLVRLYRII
jgi:hypothetical protein